MKPEYILLICAGGTFLILLLTYLIVAAQRAKADKRNKTLLSYFFNDENLRKMEYDVAFYEKNVFWFNFTRENERQVTIDDLLIQNAGDMSRLTEEAVFTQLEDEGVEEVKGTYRP